MQPTRLFDLTATRSGVKPGATCIAEWSEDGIAAWSCKDLQAAQNRYLQSLMTRGVRPGDIVIICSKFSTRAEVGIEMAIMQAGAIVCPLSTYLSEEELSDIVRGLRPKLIISQEISTHLSFKEIIEDSPESGLLVECLLFEDIQANEGSVPRPELPDVDPDDCAVIMYTSGSNGQPKGVMLSHRNILSNVDGLRKCMPIKRGHRVISYLSRSHIMERTATYTYLAAGASVYFVPSPLMLQQAIRQVRPKWMTAVPLILERLYAQIFHQVEIGKWYERALFAGSRKSGITRLLARIFIINAWKRKYGKGLRGVIVGGAAMSADIARLFNASGIRIREGYGLTETSPAITFNRYQKRKNKFGTAGIPLESVSVRIRQPDPDTSIGEIEVKGPNVMLGYYNDENATKSRITDDGWFRTGDLGKWVDGKFLQITDRISNIFKNASGRFVSPAPIEQELTAHPAIDQALVYGLNRPFNTALIIPDFNWLRTWARKQGVHWTDNAYMIHNPKVEELFDQILEGINNSLKPHERLRRHILGKKRWTRDEGLLSITLKPRRKNILQEFEKQIGEIYEKPSMPGRD